MIPSAFSTVFDDSREDALFITFEGIDGCGKSTQARYLSDFLSRRFGAGNVLWTREPGGWPGSGPLREMLLSGDLAHPWTEVFLFLADRCEHARKVIEPAVSSGIQVICERYDDSTLAYQVWGRGLPLETVEKAIEIADHPAPQKTVFIDIRVETALERICSRSGLDRYEREGRDFLSRIQEGYRFLMSREPERFIPVDGEQKPEKVFSDVLRSLEGLL